MTRYILMHILLVMIHFVITLLYKTHKHPQK